MVASLRILSEETTNDIEVHSSVLVPQWMCACVGAWVHVKRVPGKFGYHWMPKPPSDKCQWAGYLCGLKVSDDSGHSNHLLTTGQIGFELRDLAIASEPCHQTVSPREGQPTIKCLHMTPRMERSCQKICKLSLIMRK